MTPEQRAALIEDLVNSKFLILAGMQGGRIIDTWLKTLNSTDTEGAPLVLNTFHRGLRDALRATQRHYATIYPDCDVKKDFQNAIWGVDPLEEKDKNPPLLKRNTPHISADEGVRRSGLVCCYNKEEWQQNDPLNTKALEKSLAQQTKMTEAEKQRRLMEHAAHSERIRIRKKFEAESPLDIFLIKYAHGIGEFLLENIDKLTKIAEPYQKMLYQKIAAYRAPNEEKARPAAAQATRAATPEVETDVATDPEEESNSIAMRVKLFRKRTATSSSKASPPSFFKTASSTTRPLAAMRPASAKAAAEPAPLPAASLKRIQSEPINSATTNTTKKTKVLPSSFSQATPAAAKAKKPAPITKEDKKLMDFLEFMDIDPSSVFPQP